MTEDSYFTITKSGESLFKDRGSKFYGYAFHIKTEDDLKAFLIESKKEHFSARHHCYGFRTGMVNTYFRANDDGEPSHSAGTPILNQILSNNLYFVAVVVVRYFGGTKLGVPGLINAYKTAAQEAIENAVIQKKYRVKTLQFTFAYADMNKVMRVIKQHDLKIKEQNSTEIMEITLVIRVGIYEQMKDLFAKLRCVTFVE